MDLFRFVAAILKSCLRYHHVGVTDPSHFAPSISGIFDRDLDSDSSFFRYSAGLKNSSGNWTKEKIVDFYKKPSKVSPLIIHANLPKSSRL